MSHAIIWDSLQIFELRKTKKQSLNCLSTVSSFGQLHVLCKNEVSYIEPLVLHVYEKDVGENVPLKLFKSKTADPHLPPGPWAVDARSWNCFDIDQWPREARIRDVLDRQAVLSPHCGAIGHTVSSNPGDLSSHWVTPRTQAGRGPKPIKGEDSSCMRSFVSGWLLISQVESLSSTWSIDQTLHVDTLTGG